MDLCDVLRNLSDGVCVNNDCAVYRRDTSVLIELFNGNDAVVVNGVLHRIEARKTSAVDVEKTKYVATVARHEISDRNEERNKL